jgi:hypothetical protein
MVQAEGIGPGHMMTLRADHPMARREGKHSNPASNFNREFPLWPPGT